MPETKISVKNAEDLNPAFKSLIKKFINHVVKFEDGTIFLEMFMYYAIYVYLEIFLGENPEELEYNYLCVNIIRDLKLDVFNDVEMNKKYSKSEVCNFLNRYSNELDIEKNFSKFYKTFYEYIKDEILTETGNARD